MKKKVVAAMLVTCMAVSLTACGSKDSSDKTDKTTAKTETASDNSDTDKTDSKTSDSKKEETRIISVKDLIMLQLEITKDLHWIVIHRQ